MDKKKEILELRYQMLHKRRELMPQVWFFLGLIWGLLLNLVANIIDDSFKTLNPSLYHITVIGITLVTLGIFIFFLMKYYFLPIQKAEEEIRILENN